jgi:amino acid transporter
VSAEGRQLTLVDCFGIGINGIIGSGIFLLPATLLRRAGGAAPIAWVMDGAFCALVGLCFAEAAGRTDRQGGPYRYAFDAFGPTAALLVGWISLVSTTLGFAAVARAVADHAVALLGAHGRAAVPAVVVLLVGILATLNILGVRPGARTSSVVSVLKIGALVGFCVVGVRFLGASAFAALPDPDPDERTGLLGAAFAGLFATTGFEYVPVPAGEAKNPRRDVGIATVGSILGATVLYALVQTVGQAAAPAMGHAKTPIVDAAAAMLGEGGRTAMLAAALVSGFGFCASSALVAPRYLESLAHDGFLPAFIGGRSSRWGTPAAAVGVVSVVVLVLACTLDFEHLADTSVVAIVVQYIGTALSVVALRRRAGPSNGFRLPLGPTIPLTAVGGSFLFLAGAGWRDLLLGLVLLLVGGAFGTLMRRTNAGRREVTRSGPAS